MGSKLATHFDLVPRAKKASDCNCTPPLYRNSAHTDNFLFYSILLNFSLILYVMGEEGQ